MSEMAKYLKKRRLSLRDIIFKTLKSSRGEIGEVFTEKLGDEGGVGGRSGVVSQRDHDDDCVGKVIDARSCGAASGSQRHIGDGNGCGDLIINDSTRRREHGAENSDTHLLSLAIDTRQVEIDSDENSTSDRSEQFRLMSGSESSDEDFLMVKYFDSLDLSQESCEKQALSVLGLPPINSGSCRSLSAIPWSGLRKDNSMSKSCYEICSNKVPGTPCGSLCSTPGTRRGQLGSVLTASCSSNACSESENEFVNDVSLETTTKTATKFRPASASSSSRHKMLAPLNLNRKKLREHAALHTSRRSPRHRTHYHQDQLTTDDDPLSSLHVSPNLSPNVSDNAPPSPMSLTSQTLPAISPFSMHPATSDFQHRHRCPMRPKSATALSFRPSTSNPNLHKTFSEPHQQPKYLTSKTFMLSAKAPIFTRSNPNLFVTPPKGSVSKCYSGSGSSDSSRHHLSSSPTTPSPTTPTPPLSPRPLSGCGRPRRMRAVKSKYQEITLDVVCDERLAMT